MNNYSRVTTTADQASVQMKVNREIAPLASAEPKQAARAVAASQTEKQQHCKPLCPSQTEPVNWGHGYTHCSWPSCDLRWNLATPLPHRAPSLYPSSRCCSLRLKTVENSNGSPKKGNTCKMRFSLGVNSEVCKSSTTLQCNFGAVITAGSKLSIIQINTLQ